MNTAEKKKSDDRNVWITLAIAFITILIGVISLHWSKERLDEGELVLTAAGCEALRYHGTQVIPLDHDSLCAIRTKFRHYSGSETVVVLSETANGSQEIVLSASAVVSQAAR